MAASCDTIFRGTAFTSVTPDKIRILEDALFCVNGSGMIESVLLPEDDQYAETSAQGQKEDKLVELQPGEFFLPGFVDLHIHAPQWPQIGTALDLPLNDWLNTCTFPLESRYSDMHYARKVYTHLVETLIANGTTTAMYFATIHKQSSFLLAEICAEKGQRALVGKVVMDHPDENPDFYRDASTGSALKDTEDFIRDVKELGKSCLQGVYPVVTPRFIPSCTDRALKGLGELAEKYDVHIQSHCSEGDWEHSFVRERFQKNDAFALNDFGLLREKSVMAHSVLLEKKDRALFKKTGTAIAHCPLSNAYFANCAAPIREYLTEGLEVGLGTDISAGYSPGIFQNLRQAVISSRMLEDGTNPDLSPEKRGKPDSRISLKEAFYLATAGGGESLSLPVGKLAPGYAFDAQVVDVKAGETPVLLFNDTDLEDVFQKILYRTTPDHIRSVYIQGRKVK